MYENELDQNWLYPGDIISHLDLPNLKKDAFILVSQNDERQQYSVRLMMSNDFFVYLSHECDYNDNKRQFLLLTPMLSIDQGLRRKAGDFSRFIESNDVRQHPHYLNQFYFAPNPPRFIEDKIIDFTRLISFPTRYKNELLKKKCLQLIQEQRNFLKEKIGYYFIHTRDE